MVKCPVFLLYYDSGKNRLFALDKQGEAILPIFNDIMLADEFRRKVNRLYKEDGMEKSIIINICHSIDHFKSLLASLYSTVGLRSYCLNPVEDLETLSIADLLMDLENM